MPIGKPYPYKAVLFDLDGVLIDTTDLHYRVWYEFARSKGVVLSEEQLRATNGRRAEENIRLLLGDNLTDRQVASLTSDRERHYHYLLEAEPVAAIPGAVDFVRELVGAGVAVGVATSAIPENAWLSLTKIGLADVFGVVLTAADVKNGKPDPEPYLKLAMALGYAAADCMVIEDSISGIRAAKASGAKCLAVATTLPEKLLVADSPDWLIKGFAQLPSALRPKE